MTALTEVATDADWLAMREEELISVLRDSIYPGAKTESIKMAIGYCKAAGLDPLQKPVHLVPMSVKKPGTRDQYEWRDVVMPGIGLYRTQAARSKVLAGISEPEFGPMIEISLGGETYTVPEWCRVTVYRLVDGEPRSFTALEFWVENYATAGRNTDAPNAMWKKRPRGQLAKCAEAQALRKAFPEFGSAPTAEEMEGKVYEGEVVAGSDAPRFNVGRKSQPAAQPAEGRVIDAEAEQVETEPKPKAAKRKESPAADPAPAPASNGGSEFVGIGEQNYIKNKAAAVGADLDELLADAGGLVLDRLTRADFVELKSRLMRMG